MLVELQEGAAPKTEFSQLSPIFAVCLLRLFDPFVVAATGFGVYLLYVYPGPGHLDSQYLSAVVAGALVASVIFQWCGVYAKGAALFAVKRTKFHRVLAAWAISFAILLALAFALKISSSYSRVWATTWFGATAGLLLIGRPLIVHWLFRLAREGHFAARTVIVGVSEQGLKLAAHLNQNHDASVRILGFVEDRKSRLPGHGGGYDYEILGDTKHLIELIRRNEVDQVFLALPWHAKERLRELTFQLAATPVRICLAPDLIGFEFPKHSYTQVADVPTLLLFDRPISGWSYVFKAVEDYVLASLALIFLAPLLLLVALAIKLESPGPVFFKQQRMGFNNKLFEIWKFRTMRTDFADPDCEVQTTRNDSRVTRVGRFLRRSSLDEFAQLFNVLRGDMSLVGPRPHALGTKAEGCLFAEVVDHYVARHKVKPGITGWAQVNGWRGETRTIEDIEKRVEYDLYYIENWSVWFDLVIILKTFVAIFSTKNAY